MAKCILVFALMIAVVTPAVAEETRQDECPTVTLQFRGAALSEVLGELATEAAVEIVIDPDAEEITGGVTVELVNVCWREAFDDILTINALVGEQEEGGYVVRRAEVGLRHSEPEAPPG